MHNIQRHPSTRFDAGLQAIDGLTWLPWVGSNFETSRSGERVLIVGESHYCGHDDPVEAKKLYREQSGDPNYTRDVVSESLVHDEWSTPTLRNYHRLFYSPKDRAEFWADVSYYNLVQRLMTVENGSFTRPSWQDFQDGWKVFLRVIDVLKPDHVLMIGVESTYHFQMVRDSGRKFSEIDHPEKVGAAWARVAGVEADDRMIPLHFIRHCGSYFSVDRWSDYLHRHARPMMSAIARSAGGSIPEAPAHHLHVLGMAKSSLDLRGAKAPKLELDFLRLAYAVRELRESGEDAIGYLMVLVPKVAETAEGWRDKYDTGDGVIVLCENLEGDNMDALIKEKADNAIGFLHEHRFNEAEQELSLADLGKQLGETALRKEIEARHPGITDSAELPHGILWDYYGVLPTVH